MGLCFADFDLGIGAQSVKEPYILFVMFNIICWLKKESPVLQPYSLFQPAIFLC